jgi:hypothetical protein
MYSRHNRTFKYCAVFFKLYAIKLVIFAVLFNKDLQLGIYVASNGTAIGVW